jgi:hypothetical protein
LQRYCDAVPVARAIQTIHREKARESTKWRAGNTGDIIQ